MRSKLEELSAYQLVEFADIQGLVPETLQDLVTGLAREQDLKQRKQKLRDQRKLVPRSLDQRLSTVEEEVDELRREVAFEIECMQEEREPVDNEDVPDPEGEDD